MDPVILDELKVSAICYEIRLWKWSRKETTFSTSTKMQLKQSNHQKCKTVG